MIERLFAGLAVLVCLVLLLRVVLPSRRRVRFDAAVRRAWATMKRAGRRLSTWRSSRRRAEQVAQEAIRRARGAQVDRDGNVYKPKFRGPRKPH